METRRPRGRLIHRSVRTARRAARVLGDAGQRLAERLAYRPREVVVVALLAAGLFGGLAIERWRAQHPAIAERLEQEPARPAVAAVGSTPPRRRARSGAVRCEAPDAEVVAATPSAPRLDLNRATPDELARAAGISWRLAARIVAARDVFEGRATPQGAPDGEGWAAGTAPSVPEPVGPSTTEPVPDAESP
jgi:hypothetical protein